MNIFFVIGIDGDIIQIHNDKDIKFFSKNLIDISLGSRQCIYQSEKHYLILNMAILSLESRLSFIFFANSHLIVYIDKIELG